VSAPTCAVIYGWNSDVYRADTPCTQYAEALGQHHTTLGRWPRGKEIFVPLVLRKR
jgi:hypothetical protein